MLIGEFKKLHWLLQWKFKLPLNRTLQYVKHFLVFCMMDSLYKMDKLSFLLIGKNGFHIKAENESFSVPLLSHYYSSFVSQSVTAMNDGW